MTKQAQRTVTLWQFQDHGDCIDFTTDPGKAKGVFRGQMITLSRDDIFHIRREPEDKKTGLRKCAVTISYGVARKAGIA